MIPNKKTTKSKEVLSDQQKPQIKLHPDNAEFKKYIQDRDEAATNHYIEFQRKDEDSQANGNMAIERRFSSFCYGADWATKKAEENVKVLELQITWLKSQRNLYLDGMVGCSKVTQADADQRKIEDDKFLDQALKIIQIKLK